MNNKRTQSRSDVQQKIEAKAIAKFEKKYHIKLEQGKKIEGTVVDGYCKTDTDEYIVEVWAHIGLAKAGQRKKVLTDLFKMVYLKQLLETEDRKVKCYMLFVDTEAANALGKGSWGKQAAIFFGIHLETIPVSEEDRGRILKAQEKQDVTVR